jgi:hypothetical protein
MSGSVSQSTPRTITSGRLTTCGVIKEGSTVRLDFLDSKREPYSNSAFRHDLLVQFVRLSSSWMIKAAAGPAAPGGAARHRMLLRS